MVDSESESATQSQTGSRVCSLGRPGGEPVEAQRGEPENRQRRARVGSTQDRWDASDVRGVQSQPRIAASALRAGSGVQCTQTRHRTGQEERKRDSRKQQAQRATNSERGGDLEEHNVRDAKSEDARVSLEQQQHSPHSAQAAEGSERSDRWRALRRLSGAGGTGAKSGPCARPLRYRRWFVTVFTRSRTIRKEVVVSGTLCCLLMIFSQLFDGAPWHASRPITARIEHKPMHIPSTLD